MGRAGWPVAASGWAWAGLRSAEPPEAERGGRGWTGLEWSEASSNKPQEAQLAVTVM